MRTIRPCKVMLVLTKTLGDVVLIHNLIDGIHKEYKDPEIDIFVDEKYKDIIVGNPKMSVVYCMKSWLNNWAKILERTFEYDVVLIPQQLHMEDNVWHQLDHLRHQHLVDFYLDRCRLPKRTKEDKLKIFPLEDDVDAVKALEIKSPYIVIHTTSLVPSKDWSYFNELTLSMIHEGVDVVQVGADTDTLVDKAMDLRSKLSFKQIAVLCSKAKCFVGLDSGLSYVSAASGAKTIVLQGATVPETSGPFGENVINIVSETREECKDKRCHGNCKFNDKCINRISIIDVLAEVKKC